jgi:sulfite reductase (NADPH) flavoprotein alpha-component
MAEGYPSAGPQDADLLDLLDAFPSARPPISEMIAALDPLQRAFRSPHRRRR